VPSVSITVRLTGLTQHTTRRRSHRSLNRGAAVLRKLTQQLDRKSPYEPSESTRILGQPLRISIRPRSVRSGEPPRGTAAQERAEWQHRPRLPLLLLYLGGGAGPAGHGGAGLHARVPRARRAAGGLDTVDGDDAWRGGDTRHPYAGAGCRWLPFLRDLHRFIDLHRLTDSHRFVNLCKYLDLQLEIFVDMSRCARCSCCHRGPALPK
jgi:hypothetical protein